MKLVLATLLILSSFPLFAGGKEETEAEIAKTDQLITKASDVLSFDSGLASSSNAQQVLDYAKQLQAKAKVRFNLRHYKEALKLTLGARHAARRAIELALGFELTNEKIKHSLQRTDDLISKASTYIQEADNQKVNELYRVALGTQQSAHESFKNNRLIIALKLTLSARRMLLRLIKMTQDISVDKVDRELKKTDRLIARVKDGNGRLDQIRNLQKSAYNQYNSKRYIQSYRLTKQAQKILYSILKDVEDVDPEEIRDAIEETENILALTDIDSSTRAQILSIIDEAKNALSSGRYNESLVKISAAKRLLDKAIEE